MGRATISREEFNALRAGDVVVWRGKYLRTVAKGPADAEGFRYNAVEFPIRRRSWTQRIETTYNYGDLKDRIAVVPQRVRGLMLASEWKVLEAAGFNVRKELQRELERQTAEAERMGRPPCKAYPRLARLIRGVKSPAGRS